MNVDTTKLRQFINDHFGPEDLRTFLFDYFRPVYDDLTDSLTKSRQTMLLLEYCQKYEKYPNLLAAIQRERIFFQPDDYIQGQNDFSKRNPRQIFISHAHQDAEVAQRLANDLRLTGYDIWIAPDSIRPGEKWIEAISRGLEESGVFVLLLSPDAVASRWVQMETNVAITYTHEDEIQFFPLMLRPCRLPVLWRAFQYITLRADYNNGLEKLTAELKSNLPLERSIKPYYEKSEPEKDFDEFMVKAMEYAYRQVLHEKSRRQSEIVGKDRLLDEINPLKLLDILDEYFGSDEIREICFALSTMYSEMSKLDYENLYGETKRSKALALVQFTHRRGYFKELAVLCFDKRPNLSWRF